MVTADDELRTLNVAIGAAETRGDQPFLDALLAPAFAMRRADGVHIVDRVGFLGAVAPSGRRNTVVDSVEVISNRAIVRCTVELSTPDGPRRFDNLRVFTRRDAGEPWQLLAWANEPIT